MHEQVDDDAEERDRKACRGVVPGPDRRAGLGGPAEDGRHGRRAFVRLCCARLSARIGSASATSSSATETCHVKPGRLRETAATGDAPFSSTAWPAASGSGLTRARSRSRWASASSPIESSASTARSASSAERFSCTVTLALRMSEACHMVGPMHTRELLVEKLTRALVPSELTIEDDSEKHRGHKGAGAGGHFRVRIVSAAFEGQPLLARHRLVHDALAEEMICLVHALEVHTLTPAEADAQAAAADGRVFVHH